MSDSAFPKETKTVQEYQTEIMETRAKIRELQDKCTHPNYEVHMYMWRPGAMHPQRLCTTCEALLPGTTQEETDAAWAEWRRMQETAGLKNVDSDTK